MTEPEDEPARSGAAREVEAGDAAGDWRTSPTTGELEYFNGLDWVRSRSAARDSEFLIRPVPPAEQAPADPADPAGSESG